ncbi:PLP-dependent transferase [Lineolata rhizophorae]|uniref:PLP-dependent transferase n=1 Tax=Lineolata rhizophorae TaxID=578093 RepID=A0A6A6NTX9_9PEZI|nr:PLP-dependent transferase [Lineolata rhizophorae]
MHSGTKYLGGHSDLLCGVLAVRKGETERWKGLWLERCTLGLVMGSLEGWLGVRSLRTLEVRVKAQSENAGRLVAWLDGALKGGREEGEGEDAAEAEVVRKVVKEVKHASLQAEDMHWLKKQMPNGFGPVFSIYMKTMQQARALPSKLRFFHHATSLGGVESLIEWRRMTDAGVDETMLRLSIGIENWVDLKNDLAGAFKAVAEMGN